MDRQDHGFMGAVRGAVRHAASFLSASIATPIAEGADRAMKGLDERLMRIERRILRKITSRLIILSGTVFLILALFFFLRDSIGWSTAATFLAIGAPVAVIGLLLKAGEPER